MYLRSDLRYGDDDPLSWPQPYVPQYCHFPVIRSIPLNSSESHSDAPLYWLPGNADFYEADSDGDCRGPGFLLDHKSVWFQNRVNVTIQRGKNATFSEAAEDLKCGYLLLLHDFLDRLRHLPMSLEKVQLTVCETQRVTLYLQALVDYMLIYKPRMDAVPDASTLRKADPDLIGHIPVTFMSHRPFFMQVSPFGLFDLLISFQSSVSTNWISFRSPVSSYLLTSIALNSGPSSKAMD